jgi:hypothetical protein
VEADGFPELLLDSRKVAILVEEDVRPEELRSIKDRFGGRRRSINVMSEAMRRWQPDGRAGEEARCTYQVILRVAVARRMGEE